MSKSVIGSADYPTIQAALDAAGVGGGGTVVLAPGVQNISAALNLPQGVTLVASGWRSTKLVATAPMAAMINIAGTAQLSKNGCCVQGIALDGANLATVGVNLDYARNGNVLRGLYIENCSKGVLFQHGSWINHIKDCRIVHCGRGIELQSNSNAVTLTHIQAEYCTGAGVWMEDSSNIRLFGGEISGNGTAGLEQYGVAIRGGESYELLGCYLEGNGAGAGRNVSIDAGAGLDVCRSVTLQSCYFVGLDTLCDYAVEVDYCASLSVLSCHSQRHRVAMINAKSTEAKRITRLGVDTIDPIWIDGVGSELRNLDSLYIDQAGRFKQKDSSAPTIHIQKVQNQTQPLFKVSDYDGTNLAGIDATGNVYMGIGRGLMLTSPDGSKWKQTIDNAGAVSWVKQ